MTDKEWVIIGGGVCGVAAAVHLIKLKEIDSSRLMLIDPAPELLYEWKRKAARTGMTHLRSPSVHHLDVEPFSLQSFAKKYRWKTGFSGPYKKPSVELFHAHCDSLIQTYQLKDSHCPDTVIKLDYTKGKYVISTQHGQTIVSDNVIVATGRSNQLNQPDWVKASGLLSTAHIAHVLSSADISDQEISKPLLVVGGGITACQTALKWSEKFPGEVILNSRHDFRISEFDSSPGWMGPKLMASWSDIDDPQQRRAMVSKARLSGSIPGSLNRRIKKAILSGKVHFVKDQVETVSKNSNKLRVTFSQKDALTVKSILLCTGYDQLAAVPEWLADFAVQYNLPSAPCGTPLPDSRLKWHDGLFLMGPLTDLILGPTARNIAGAKKAAGLIAQA
ncbi:hypothetical protein ADIAL_0308 [Alkalibacterium sp. AK22]|uniref:FAD-dependent oxidoreductase n=1 Tax=Alkalibacterium sp. AK22 TaxID=1229520 RepID=UPI00044F5DC5|nr:FAD/NAD(P)-binding protein [Alkalibacterium sp. AK22]EXJ24177.1 hypothetical protein ADIAL_0308 [Alkalibacterium sp. AK22]